MYIVNMRNKKWWFLMPSWKIVPNIINLESNWKSKHTIKVTCRHTIRNDADIKTNPVRKKVIFRWRKKSPPPSFSLQTTHHLEGLTKLVGALLDLDGPFHFLGEGRYLGRPSWQLRGWMGRGLVLVTRASATARTWGQTGKTNIPLIYLKDL